jgi:hypothetical protein
MVYLLVQQQYQVFTQPYLWDELGVYSRSSSHMFHHGLSLLPSSVPDELSRGHPLLCSFYFALAFKIFGCNPVTAHFAAALLNMLGFYFCYRILARYMTLPLAVFSALAIFVQPLFLSQSVLILPEMPLMVATLGVVNAYIYKKKWAVMIWLVLALQIKESALVLPVACLLTDIINYKKIRKEGLVFYFLVPVLSFMAFISIQKYQSGYFFYPLHTELSSFDMYYIHERWSNFKRYFLHEQGRYGIWIMACLTALVWVFKKGRGLVKLRDNKMLLVLFIIAGSLCFLVLNYYLSRYTMYFIVLFYTLLLILIVKTYRKYLYLQVLLIGIIMGNGIYNWNNGREYTDVDFSYADHIKSLELVIEEMNQHYKGKTIGMDFPLSAAYWSNENGYKTGSDVHSVPMQDSLPIKDYLVFTHPGNLADTIKYQGRIVCVKELRSGYALARIYQLKKE